MKVHFETSAIERIINRDMEYAQIEFIKNCYFDFPSDHEHLITLEVNENSVEDISYYLGYYKYYRVRDYNRFKQLVLNQSVI